MVSSVLLLAAEGAVPGSGWQAAPTTRSRCFLNMSPARRSSMPMTAAAYIEQLET